MYLRIKKSLEHHTPLIEQMTKFIENLQMNDRNIEVFDIIARDIEKGYKFLQKR